MFSIAQARNRALWYSTLATVLFAVAVTLLLLWAVKTAYEATGDYQRWPRLLFVMGWWVQWFARRLYSLDVVAGLWNWLPSMARSPIWFLSPPIVLMVNAVYLGGLLQRAGAYLRRELKQAQQAAQQAVWQEELLRKHGGQASQPQPRAPSIGVYIDLRQQPLPKTPWWTHPWGILLLAVAGGIVSGIVAGVLTQWLNVSLGLAH